MRVGHLRAITASFIVSLVALLVLSGIPGLTAAYTPNETGTRQGELILKVGRRWYFGDPRKEDQFLTPYTIGRENK